MSKQDKEGIVIARPGWVNGRKAFVVAPQEAPRILVPKAVVRRRRVKKV